jgi:rare lipoprotein A
MTKKEVTSRTIFSIFAVLVFSAIAGGQDYITTSYYGPGFHGRQTANKEVFDMYSLTCAHRTLAFNTWLEIQCDQTMRSIIARVNDRGPFWPGRDLDVSYAVAYHLGILEIGVADVRIREIKFSKGALKCLERLMGSGSIKTADRSRCTIAFMLFVQELLGSRGK